MTFEEWYYKTHPAGLKSHTNNCVKAAMQEAWTAGYRHAMDPIQFGHNEICEFCNKRCDGLSAMPSMWPLMFTRPKGKGIPKAHHVGCVQERLFNPMRIKLDAYEVEKLKWALKKINDEDGNLGLNTGDWVMQIYRKLPDVGFKPAGEE